MPGCVDQVEDVALIIFRYVIHAYSVGFDRDPPLAFQVHVVEHLVHHLLPVNREGVFQKTVGEGGLAVVDVRNDAEVADVFGAGHEVCSEILKVGQVQETQ